MLGKCNAIVLMIENVSSAQLFTVMQRSLCQEDLYERQL